MTRRSVFRVFMLAAGLLAVAVILLSASLSIPTIAKTKASTKTEESSQTFVSAPTEAIPGSAIGVADETAPSLLEILHQEENEEIDLPAAVAKELVHYFKVLFRAIISPNAP